ncbi:PAS domain S-box protein [Patescibacteria group bacterium]|nr:PAS domain S-box protein [Patescibacteria group bacterium]
MFIDLAQIFSLTFNPYGLIPLVTVLLNLSLMALLIYKGSQVPSTRWFILAILVAVSFGVSATLQSFSASAEAANYWGLIGGISTAFGAPVLLAFTLVYTGNEKILTSFFRQVLIFGPALFFLFIGWTTDLIYSRDLSQFQRLSYGWESPQSTYGWVATLWLAVLFILALFVLIRHWNQSRSTQTLLLVIALLIPIIGGVTFDSVLPLVFDIQLFPITSILTTVMGVIVTYAIVRYGLFAISPILTANTIVDTMSEALLVIRPDNTIEQVNKAALDLLGFKSEELLGQSIRKIWLDENSWERFLMAAFTSKEEKSVIGFDIDFQSKGGERIPVNFSATSLVEKNHLLGIVGLARDMRETEKLINRITAERNKMSVTLGGLVEGIFAVNKQGKIILSNPALEKMLGFEVGGVIGEHADEVINMSAGETRVLIKDLLPKEKILKDQIVTTKKNIKISKRDGSFIYVDLTSSSIPETEEMEFGATITFRNVSKEHEFEEMKLDFVSMAAHELRTPLTAIRGYLSVLQEETAQSLDKEQRSFLDKAFISSSQLAALIENLLSVSRIERGRMKIEKNLVDWEKIVAEVVESFMGQARHKEVDLKLKKPSRRLPKTPLDKFRMSEVLNNLIGNAVTYTDPGGSIELSIELEDKEIITHIKDTGQGIPKEALPKLFTKFFRVSGVLEQGSKGTGLGLYIAKAIVDMHNGRIWAKSILGKGSTFSFSLPLETEEEVKPGLLYGNQQKQDEKEVVGVTTPVSPQKRTFLKNGKQLLH